MSECEHLNSWRLSSSVKKLRSYLTGQCSDITSFSGFPWHYLRLLPNSLAVTALTLIQLSHCPIERQCTPTVRLTDTDRGVCWFSALWGYSGRQRVRLRNNWKRQQFRFTCCAWSSAVSGRGVWIRVPPRISVSSAFVCGHCVGLRSRQILRRPTA
jgi:hypothetical protein